VSLKKARDTHELLRDEMIYQGRILALLDEEPKSVVQVASALDMPAHEVMRWMMAMRRYEKIEETGSAGEDGGMLYEVRQQGEEAS